MAVKTTLNKSRIFKLMYDHEEELIGFGVSRLGLFGSAVRGDASGESDVDVLVEFLEGKKNYDNFINLAFLLEDLFERKVDLVTDKSIGKRLKKNIYKEIEYVSFNSRVS
jgi:predicted nucleotidyltransferase